MGLPSTTISGLQSTETSDGSRLGGGGQRQEDVGQGVAIDGRLATERTQDRLGLQLVDHVQRIDAIDRDHPHRDVGDRLGQDAAHAHQHRHAELGVGGQTGDELPLGVEHRGDQQVDGAVLGAGRGEQIGGGSDDGVAVSETQSNEAAFGLVGDGVPAELADDGMAQRCRRLRRLGGGVDHTLVHDRHAVAGQQRLGRGLGQRSGAGGHGLGPYCGSR